MKIIVSSSFRVSLFGSLKVLLLTITFLSPLCCCTTTMNNPTPNPTTTTTTTPIIKKVVVVGGTHGNEYTGVWVTKALDRRIQNQQQQNQQQGQPSLLYKSFHLSTLIGNPEAHWRNQRFVDQDLNRRFSRDALLLLEDFDKNNDETTKTNAAAAAAHHVEVKRAAELNQLLGPKQFDDTTTTSGNSDDGNDGAKVPKVDLLIDLHTTTTNMHTTLIIAKGDPLTSKAAAYVILQNCKNKNNKNNKYSDTFVLMHTHPNQDDRPHLSSIAPHCLSIECGPVPTGVLRHDIVEDMQAALDATLEFLDRYQTEPATVDRELQDAFPSGRLPCFVSAPSQRPGEISGKIAWPCDPENPNFPAWIVHQSVQDRDFAEIKTGDPLFVDLDGTVIPYDGSHGSPVHLLFVNEAGYYYQSSGTGISVANKRQFEFETAELVPLQEEEETKESSSSTGSSR